MPQKMENLFSLVIFSRLKFIIIFQTHFFDILLRNYIDLERNVLRVGTWGNTKNGEERLVTIRSSLKNNLLKYLHYRKYVANQWHQTTPFKCRVGQHNQTFWTPLNLKF
jgi:hypothetical protein